MKPIRLLPRLALLAAVVASALSFSSSAEVLNYKVIYKWGLIHKQAGRATFRLQDRGSQNQATMAARTEPWADRFFKVRDTLITVFDKSTRLPSSYHRIAHEDGSYAHDHLVFSQFPDGKTQAKCVRIRRGKKATEDTRTEIDLEAQGATVDLLSSFYYLRNMDFSHMKPGQQKVINIFSGKRKELLTIAYVGRETVEIDKRKFACYKVTFKFTSEGKKKTSDPIEAWIATDSRIPVKLVGSLPIGKVQCIYQP